MAGEVDFSPVDTQVFYNLIVSLSVCLTKHVQSTPKNKFTISLPADKPQRFVGGKACTN